MDSYFLCLWKIVLFFINEKFIDPDYEKFDEHFII